MIPKIVAKLRGFRWWQFWKIDLIEEAATELMVRESEVMWCRLRIDEKDEHIAYLAKRLEEIIAKETPRANATVRNMANVAREALASIKG